EPAAPYDRALKCREVGVRWDRVVLAAAVALERSQVDESSPVSVQIASGWDVGQVHPQVGAVGGAEALQSQDKASAGTGQPDGLGRCCVLKTAETAGAQDLHARRRGAAGRSAAVCFPGRGRLDDPRYWLVDGVVEEEFLRLEPHQDEDDQPDADERGGGTD